MAQSEVAQLIGVITESVTNWELARSIPQIQYFPAIRRFLGYWPRPIPQTFQQRLLAYREFHGVRRSRLAKQLGIDDSTLAKLERGVITREAKTMLAHIQETLQLEY